MKNMNSIITGGARGIGKAIAMELAARGSDVILWDVMEEEVKATAAEVAQVYGIEALGTRVDVTDAASVDAALKEARALRGEIDCLVNNAGITRDNLLVRMKEEDWDLVLRINLKGVFLCTKAVGRFMCKARKGAIVNIASVVGIMGNAGQANYSASKAGVIGLTKTSAREFASRGVRVNAVAPGYIRTDMTDKLSEEVREEVKAHIPLAALGEPEDVARAVAFLASDAARYITGQVLAVDGGMVM